MGAIPVVAGLPFIGSTIPFARDPYGFLRRTYRELGPVFRVRLATQAPTMMVGVEANLLLRKLERTHFEAASSFEPLGRALGTRRFLLAMDGPDHKALRGAFAPAWTFDRMAEYVEHFADVTRRSANAWARGRRRNVVPQIKRMVFEQLGGALSPQPAHEYYDDVLRVFDTAVKIGVARIWPEWMARTPWNRRSMDRLRELALRLQREPRSRGEPSFVDLVSDAVRAGLLESSDLLASLMTPYFAGIDTVGSTLAFGVHVLATREDVVTRLRDEVDGLSDLSLASLKRARTLRAFVSELLRLYPVGVLTMRQTTLPVELGGVMIPPGTPVGFSPAVPHFLSEHFGRPFEFDMDRWESKPAPGTYAPWGVGAHVCLGAGIAEAQMLTTFAVLLREFDCRLVDREYTLRQVLDPLPTPRGLDVRWETR